MPAVPRRFWHQIDAFLSTKNLTGELVMSEVVDLRLKQQPYVARIVVDSSLVSDCREWLHLVPIRQCEALT
jgi:hypothetical protein